MAPVRLTSGLKAREPPVAAPDDATASVANRDFACNLPVTFSVAKKSLLFFPRRSAGRQSSTTHRGRDSVRLKIQKNSNRATSLLAKQTLPYCLTAGRPIYHYQDNPDCAQMLGVSRKGRSCNQRLWGADNYRCNFAWSFLARQI